MVRYNNSLNQRRLNLVRSDIDAGGAAGSLRIRSGARPAVLGGATDQLVLSTHLLAYPCGTVATSSNVTSLAFSAIAADELADATGTAAWAELLDSTGTVVADMSAGVTGSGADLELGSTALQQNGRVEITSAKISAYS